MTRGTIWVGFSVFVDHIKVYYNFFHSESHAHDVKFVRSSEESVLKDTTQPLDHVADNELKSAAACFSLTSVTVSTDK